MSAIVSLTHRTTCERVDKQCTASLQLLIFNKCTKYTQSKRLIETLLMLTSTITYRDDLCRDPYGLYRELVEPTESSLSSARGATPHTFVKPRHRIYILCIPEGRLALGFCPKKLFKFRHRYLQT